MCRQKLCRVNLNTVFPGIVFTETYSVLSLLINGIFAAETIQGRTLFKSGNNMKKNGI